ncbi:hypothetical protein [Acinetobacter soli]|uniref:hypothetical protein n=1 Tax=Acinetobacter soli TaxID=487316 RepID=UPI00148EF123|nr:hypothetical protein [Acinetobacter soli]
MSQDKTLTPQEISKKQQQQQQDGREFEPRPDLPDENAVEQKKVKENEEKEKPIPNK